MFFIWAVVVLYINVISSENVTLSNENIFVTEYSNDLLTGHEKPEKTIRYKISYFDFRGRGEAIRLLLHYAGEPFEDFRIPKNKWLAEYKNATPYGHVPILEFKKDNRVLAESHTILRYLARKLAVKGDLAGGVGHWQQAKVDEFADFHKDTDSLIHGYLYPADKVTKTY